MNGKVLLRRRSSLQIKDPVKGQSHGQVEGQFRFLQKESSKSPKPSKSSVSPKSPSASQRQDLDGFLSSLENERKGRNNQKPQGVKKNGGNEAPTNAIRRSQSARPSPAEDPERGREMVLFSHSGNRRPRPQRRKDAGSRGYPAEVLARGVTAEGREIVYVSYDPVLAAQGIPVGPPPEEFFFGGLDLPVDNRPRPGLAVRRSVSAAPELQRVSEWLRNSDFTAGVDQGASHAKDSTGSKMSHGTKTDNVENQSSSPLRQTVANTNSKPLSPVSSLSSPPFSIPPPPPISPPPKRTDTEKQIKLKEPLMPLPSAPRHLTSGSMSPVSYYSSAETIYGGADIHCAAAGIGSS